MRMAVHGVACVGSFGFGPKALRDTLAAPVTPVFEDGRAAQADTSGLKDIFPPRSLRQMDHFTRMALLGAVRALDDAGVPPEKRNDGTALVLASGYGPAATTFAFLDSFLDVGDATASPLAFAHSVHNIPAASIVLALGLTGPCTTICQLDSPVVAALTQAFSWLEEGLAERVLLGAVEEHTPLLATTAQRISRRSPSGHRRRSALPISEGAAFFCLGRCSRQSPLYGTLRIFAADWRRPLECSAYGAQKIFCSGKVRAFSQPDIVFAENAYGNLPVAQAFDIILALGEHELPCLCLSFGEQGIPRAVIITAE
jgi:3-oxoacyl-[acyl-carrier-protein] synthase II